jgi:hypothetical protein
MNTPCSHPMSELFIGCDLDVEIPNEYQAAFDFMLKIRSN